VPLAPLALEALKRRRVEQAAERLAAGPAWCDQLGLVWTTPRGAPLARTTLWGEFQRCLARAGLPPLCWHDLRHITATLLLAAGVNPRVVQAQLGQAQIGTTLAIYSHVSWDTLQAAAVALDNLLQPRKGV